MAGSRPRCSLGRTIAAARSSGDIESEARIQSNLAHAAVYLVTARGERASVGGDRAIRRSRQARRGDSHGALRRSSPARSWSVGLSIQRLYEARRSFLMHGMVEEAGLCGLEIVEALLQIGSNEDAAHLAQEILDELRDIAFNDRALSALAFSTMPHKRAAPRPRSRGMSAATSIHYARIRPASSSRCRRAAQRRPPQSAFTVSAPTIRPPSRS